MNLIVIRSDASIFIFMRFYVNTTNHITTAVKGTGRIYLGAEFGLVNIIGAVATSPIPSRYYSSAANIEHCSYSIECVVDLGGTFGRNMFH